MNSTGFKLWGFRRPREVAIPSLGELEREVMNEIWRRGETSVRQMQEAFGVRIAYTTLMTTMDRLHKKGLLNRSKHGRAFLYSPRFSREEVERGFTEDVIEGLFERKGGEVKPILACIVDAVTERDRALLDELDRLVREKREELERKEGR